MEPTLSYIAGTGSRCASDLSFAEFVRANMPVLVRKAYLLTGSGHAAEELVQDTLVRLYPRWERVAGADVPLAYVQRSLRNNFLSQLRNGRGRELLIDAVPDVPGRSSIERETTDRDEVWALMRTLNRRQRTVLVLRFYEGLSDTEIAEYLGCRPGTVRSLASRAVAKLRERTQAA
jgi:RNA polymerase sigma-70 factor (sigma-E family)